MKIYLIRHGESTANKEKIYQGWDDVHLSPKGFEQANKLANYFKQNDIVFNNIYSSSLIRAVETAQPLLSCAINNERVIKKNNLRSINVGKWSGMGIEFVKSHMKDEYWIWKNRPKEFRFPEGESINEVLIRAKCSLHTILDHEFAYERNIALVTHMITIKVLTLWMSEIGLEEIWNPQYTVPNTGLIIFNVIKEENKGKYAFKRVNMINSTPHLD